MKERKYKEEYKLETQLDVKTGNPKQVPVYMGDYYVLLAGGKAAVLAVCLPLAVFLALYAVYMLLDSPSARCIYVMPIAACATIPALYAVLGAAGTLRAPEKMTRVQKESGIGRAMRSFLGCGVITGLSALGDAVFMARNGFSGEIAAFFALLGACSAAWLGFTRSRKLYSGVKVIPGRAAKEKEAAGA